jgi:predicted HicB family RNase H-like nuclease
MPGNRPPVVRLDTPIGPDVDLGREDVRLADDSRLTEELAAEIAEDVLRQARAGRPSLAGHAGGRSPQITFRTPVSLHDAAERQARREGKSVSQLAREALEHYLRSA